MNERKFDNIGDIYSKYRPTYAAEFIDYLYSEIGIYKESVIADIGAGTGILTKQLLDKGSTVYAAEPNADMRNIALQTLAEYPNFISIDGTAENTKIADNSVDFITVGQAFHWFNADSFKTECKRILKPGGKVVLVWNNRDKNSLLVKENAEINKRYCPNFKGFSGGIAEKPNDLPASFFTGSFEMREFENPIFYNKQTFVGRNLSSSYSPRIGDHCYDEYVSAIQLLFDKYSKDSLLCMPNITRSYVGNV